jgi:hypothetical protein
MIMTTDDLEELDLQSAVWIFASKDENHLLTFEGIRERLCLDADYDVRRTVLKRRELFRPGAHAFELEQWKAKMRTGRRVPPWIKQIEDPEQKARAIENLSEKDVFRSQFRTEPGATASSIEVINWGLDHLDRIRKGRIASREATAKSWQMWLVFWIGVANIIVSTILALSKTP